MWGGRFEGGLDPYFEEFNRSIAFDFHLAEHDLQVNSAWTKALHGAGVLTADEAQQLLAAIQRLRDKWEEDAMFVDSTCEDIHSFVEQELTSEVGALARKLHTGRSRNDQVATDLKLFLFERCAALVHALQDTMDALVGLAERHGGDPIPGYTHLQRAQPTTIGHHALAYVEMLARDRSRILEAWIRADTCPLGSAALAGTAFDIDREGLASELNFSGGPTRNSLDAVSDRDHVCETLFACSMVMLHLSRLAEDYIFFSSQEAGFVQFQDSVATGSSLMPQKKNPDAMELIRGKCGRVIGHLQGLFMTLKGLPLAYNKDLQEDKEALIDGLDQTEACLIVAATALQSVEFNVEQCRHAAATGFLNATDLADVCVRSGMPFRDAHEAVGMAVNRAVELGVELEDLPPDELGKLFPDLDLSELRKNLSVDAVLARRSTIGGTAPNRVQEEAARWRSEIESWIA